MVARLILKYPDKNLRGRSKEIDFSDWECNVAAWCQDLKDTMIVNSGLGLAGPQIGIKKRIFAIDVKELDNPQIFEQNDKNGFLFFINPTLSLLEKEIAKSIEACLSIPGVMYQVKRSPAIRLTYTTPEGEIKIVDVNGEDAVVIQHEYDHLDGKLFIDKLNPFDKKEFKKLTELPKRQKTVGEIRQLREQKKAKLRSNRKRK